MRVLSVGDLVAIRGDLRVSMVTKCAYTPDQLIHGKYIKHAGHGGIWVGIIEQICGDEALCAGGWRGMERYEILINTN